jgi:hypothetical protein
MHLAPGNEFTMLRATATPSCQYVGGISISICPSGASPPGIGPWAAALSWGSKVCSLPLPSTQCEAADSPNCAVVDKAQDDKDGESDEHPDYDRRRSAPPPRACCNGFARTRSLPILRRGFCPTIVYACPTVFAFTNVGRADNRLVSSSLCCFSIFF